MASPNASTSSSITQDKDYPPSSRKPASLRRGVMAVKHGDKLFVAVAMLICLEISWFSNLYFNMDADEFTTSRQTRTASVLISPMDHEHPLYDSDNVGAVALKQSSRHRIHREKPRLVFFEDSIGDEFNAAPNKRREVTPMGDLNCCLQDPKRYIKPDEKRFYEICETMVDWQTTFYPTCNMLHELPLIDSDDYRLLSPLSRNRTTSEEDEATVTLLNTKGSWRTVWKVTQQRYLHPRSNEPQNFVLKTLRYNREFDEESYQLQIIDSMAMERLTSSPYIVNEYGFCGQSVLTEYAAKSGREMIKNKRLKTWQRVKIAHDLSAALADMHSIDYPNATNATLTHNDINIANTVQGQPDGRIKFNDFNIGVRMRWNQTKPCGYPVHFNAPLWRSPEEIVATNTSIYVQPEKSDMYALGNLLFQVLTTHQPWTWLEPGGALSVEQVIKKKLGGDYPHIPTKFLSNSTGVQAIYYATMSCFAHDPEDRPTSFELAEALQIALEWSKRSISKTNDDIRQLFNFVQRRNKSTLQHDLDTSKTSGRRRTSEVTHTPPTSTGKSTLGISDLDKNATNLLSKAMLIHNITTKATDASLNPSALKKMDLAKTVKPIGRLVPVKNLTQHMDQMNTQSSLLARVSAKKSNKIQELLVAENQQVREAEVAKTIKERRPKKSIGSTARTRKRGNIEMLIVRSDSGLDGTASNLTSSLEVASFF
jgi:serine/threonine protein kinase